VVVAAAIEPTAVEATIKATVAVVHLDVTATGIDAATATVVALMAVVALILAVHVMMRMTPIERDCRARTIVRGEREVDV
jgi:hypothetical protein